MTPGEKYSKVLKISKKKAYKAEDEMGFGRNTLSNAIKEDREMSEEYHKKFIEHFGVNPVWWDTGKGDVILKNGTAVQKEAAINGKRQLDLAAAIHKVVEENSEYVLMHRTVLEGRYRLVAVEQFEIYEKELERKERELERKAADLIRKDTQIEGLYEIVKAMASKLPDAPKIQKAEGDASV